MPWKHCTEMLKAAPHPTLSQLLTILSILTIIHFSYHPLKVKGIVSTRGKFLHSSGKGAKLFHSPFLLQRSKNMAKFERKIFSWTRFTPWFLLHNLSRMKQNIKFSEWVQMYSTFSILSSVFLPWFINFSNKWVYLTEFLNILACT